MGAHPPIPAVYRFPGRRKAPVPKLQTNAGVGSKHPSMDDQPAFKRGNERADKMHQSGTQPPEITISITPTCAGDVLGCWMTGLRISGSECQGLSLI
ncbi:hypothetical protein ACJ73_02875 [Blastomyces percursus]|uniref:Uncharacterized protein n=1 Tax=Blastomyces percursus TaxID=1658174 RepID=A0A1J9RB53_9EURO|nr:hypothetical protein ACJ73_02875 [Blastomyces percursus]